MTATPRTHLPTVGSTGDVAREHASREGASPAFWITADEQTAGRGRLGRTWTSELGNLYATLALRDPGPSEALPTLSILAAVALRRALAEATGGDGFALKWPNDVLLGGAKVAGVLLEAFHLRGTPWVTVGCGVNCATHPPLAAYRASDLAAEGLATTPEHLFAGLDHAMADLLRAWERGTGFEAIAAEWTRHAHGLNAPATVRTPGGAVTGTIRGLAPDGRLLLETNDGTTTVTAGDIAAPRDDASDYE